MPPSILNSVYSPIRMLGQKLPNLLGNTLGHEEIPAPQAVELYSPNPQAETTPKRLHNNLIITPGFPC